MWVWIDLRNLPEEKREKKCVSRAKENTKINYNKIQKQRLAYLFWGFFSTKKLKSYSQTLVYFGDSENMHLGMLSCDIDLIKDVISTEAMIITRGGCYCC